MRDDGSGHKVLLHNAQYSHDNNDYVIRRSCLPSLFLYSPLLLLLSLDVASIKSKEGHDKKERKKD